MKLLISLTFLCFVKANILDNNLDSKYWPVQPDDVDYGGFDYIFDRDDDDIDVRNELDPMQFSQPDISGNLCTRPCDGTTRICYYKFRIEHYSAMGDACGNCTCSTFACTNVSHCDNQRCITADGFNRNMVTVNRRYPGPPIYVCKGDTVIVDVTNALQGKATTLHWHGMFQKGTPWMDGVAMVSQCPILPMNTFRYRFLASEPGTHFWHEHTGLIKLDGVQGPLIVREPEFEAPNSVQYDKDLPSHILFLTDWKHFMADDEFPDMKRFDGGKRIQALLINGKGRFETPSRLPYYYINPSARSPLKIFEVKSGHSYRFRVIGALCMMCAIELTIENHDLTVIAVDGNPVTPAIVSSVVITSGERYDIVINALRPVGSYWITVRGVSPCERTEQVALLNYQGYTGGRRNYVSPPPLLRAINHPNVSLEQPTNIRIADLKSSLHTPKYISHPTSTVRFTFVVSTFRYTMNDFTSGNAPLYFKPFVDRPAFRSTVNGISSTMPRVPLFTQYNELSENSFCSAECVNGTSPEPCQPCVHMIKIPFNRTIDFIIADPSSYTGIVHPFHLHGHKFYVLEQGMINATNTVASLEKRVDNRSIKALRPPVKDTIIVPQGTYAIIRFFTDNPGVWIFHCHYAYHNAVGMHVFLQVGEPDDFPRVPNNFPKCGDYLPPV